MKLTITFKEIILYALISFIISFGVHWFLYDSTYNKGYSDGIRVGWLKGYQQQQIEDLPALGLEKRKRINPNLLGKE
jgi:hypothetical protein